MAKIRTVLVSKTYKPSSTQCEKQTGRASPIGRTPGSGYKGRSRPNSLDSGLDYSETQSWSESRKVKPRFACYRSSRIRIFRKAPAWTDITGESRNKSQSNAALVCHRSQMLGGSPASSTTHLSISNPEKEGSLVCATLLRGRLGICLAWHKPDMTISSGLNPT